MKLNKRYTRSIRTNLPFYLSASILTAVGLLLVYLFYVAGTGIKDYGREFFAKHHVEDASFTTYIEIPDEDIAKLEEKYNVVLEKEHYSNVNEDAYTTRVFTANRKIDTYEITMGRDIETDEEILMSAGYAQNNKVALGDSFTLNGREYTVAGFFLRPDYLYMLENLTDDYKNISTFFLAYMSENAFAESIGEGNISYKVIYRDTDTATDFRTEINEAYFMASYIAAENNMRISYVDEQADMFILCAWVMLVLLPFVTVALISILIGRKIRSEQTLIGTLSALGYSRGQLMRHYSLFAVIPGVVGGILTTVICMMLQQPFGELGLADYEPMQAVFTLPWFIAAMGIVIPTLIYYACAMLRVRGLLKWDTVDLLNGMARGDTKVKRVLAKRQTKVRYKMAIRTLLSNPGRSFVIFLGIFLGAVIVAFCYIFIDSVKAVGRQAHDEFGTFRYEYILNTLREEELESGEPVMVLAYESVSRKDDAVQVSLMGMDSDTALWNLTTTDGERADLDNGWYMSTLCATIFGLQKGDTFTFRNIATLEEHSVTIDGIIKNGYQNYIVSSRENMAAITGFEAAQYNAILADKKLAIDASQITEIVSDETYQNQMENMLVAMGGLIDAMIIIGMIVCMAALYSIINMMIGENSHTISMLKVLGYDDGRINRMTILSNHFLLIPGIVAGILVAYYAMVWYVNAFVEVERIMIPATMSVRSIVLTIGLTAGSYFLSLLLIRRKVNKMDMTQSLKDSRE